MQQCYRQTGQGQPLLVEPLLAKYSTALQSTDKASLQQTLDSNPHWRSEVTKYELKQDSKRFSKILDKAGLIV